MKSTIYFYVNEDGTSIGLQGDHSVVIFISAEEVKGSPSVKSLLQLLMGKIQTQLLFIDDKESLSTN